MAGDVTLTVEELRSLNGDHYLSLISMTILVYEYFLTFTYEVQRFWRVGRLNWASALFYINRYLALFGHIPVLIEYLWRSSNPSKSQVSFICGHLQSYHQYFAVVIQVVVSSMLIMRMYALYNRDKRVLAVLVGFALVVVAIGCWAILGGHKTKSVEVLVPVGCAVTLNREQAMRLGSAWCGMLVFDGLVFGMTVYKSISSPRTRGISLVSILLRDGAMYFSIMILTNLANILTFFYGGKSTRGVATTLMNVISSVMISRLMLNLRHPSLVSHSTSTLAWSGRSEDQTYPNLTFVEPDYYQSRDCRSEHGCDHELASPPEGWGRAREMYEYLARGSSAPGRLNVLGT